MIQEEYIELKENKVISTNGEEMKRPDQISGAYGGHNYVTVIPVDYPPSESPSLTSNASSRREDPRHLPRDYSCPDAGHVAPHGLGTQPWYNRPGTRCSVSSIHSNEWTPRGNDRNSQTSHKKQDICVLLMNKVGLCLEIESLPHVTAQELLDMIFHDEQEIALPPIAKEIFTIWMISPHLELQLKPHHKPYNIRKQWDDLLSKYSNETPQELEEPVLLFKRNVFFDKKEEIRFFDSLGYIPNIILHEPELHDDSYSEASENTSEISDMKILELLYEEAKWNILEGRYICKNEDCEMLAGIQAKLELETYDRDTHTPEFFKSKIAEFLPDYACRTTWNFLGFGPKVGAEHRVFHQFISIPSKTSTYKLLRKYLEFCWSLPFYGSAFFPAQIEKPANGLAMFLNHYDTKVQIAINRAGVHIIDESNNTVILSLKYKDFSWDYAPSSNPENPTCFSCIFLQFRVEGMNRRESNVLQIFSKQAKLMDSLISSFVDELKKRSSWNEDDVDGVPSHLTGHFHDEPEFEGPMAPQKLRSEALLAAKLNRLSLATFNDAGVCLKRTGSWALRK